MSPNPKCLVSLWEEVMGTQTCPEGRPREARERMAIHKPG